MYLCIVNSTLTRDTITYKLNFSYVSQQGIRHRTVLVMLYTLITFPIRIYRIPVVNTLIRVFVNTLVWVFTDTLI